MQIKLKSSASHHHYVEHNFLDINKTYDVIGIEANDYRIIDESGRPFLYEHKLFGIIDNTRPDDWITTYDSGGEEYSYPPELDADGFFEDYFNDIPEIIETFNRYIATRNNLRK